MGEKSRESDLEIHFKDTFRAFSKDNDGKYSRVQGSLYQRSLLVKLNRFFFPHFVKPYSFIDTLGVDVALSDCPIFQLFLKLPISRLGCIPAEELKFVMNHLPGKVCIS